MMAKAKWKQMIGIRMTKPARISMQNESSNPPVKWTWPISPEYTKVGKLTTVPPPAPSSSSSSSSSQVLPPQVCRILQVFQVQ